MAIVGPRPQLVRDMVFMTQEQRKRHSVRQEWKDVADGLRAIDEAILFLNMGNGDRLGHATVLGIDIEDWYQKKNNEVWLSYQEYLDNIACLIYIVVTSLQQN